MATAWHYVQNGQSLGPVPEEELKAMLAAGSLRGEDLVWTQGMAAWTPAGQVPELRPAPPAPAPVFVAPVPMMAAPAPFGGAPFRAQATPQMGGVSDGAVALLRATKPWVRLFGVLGAIGIGLIVLGALGFMVLGATLLKGAPPFMNILVAAFYLVLAGLHLPPVIFLNRYASRIRDLMQSGSPTDLEAALRAQKSFWKYIGIFVLIYFCIVVLAIVVALVVGVAGLAKR
jgi:hypothetical protein